MTSSTEAALLRGGRAEHAARAHQPELRTGAWTRLGTPGVLGDAVTEQTLGSLAESTRHAARSQGYAVGWAEGRREADQRASLVAQHAEEERLAAEARRDAEHRAAVAALTRATRGVERALAEASDQVAAQALELARELAAIIVGHELRTTTDPSGDVVARVLAARPVDNPVVVRLHPAVLDSEAVHALHDAGATLVPDATLRLEDAVVEAADHVLDLRVSGALARVAEVLS